MTSVSQLEREAEARRARVAEAVDGIRLGIEESANSLRENLSPARIVRRNSEKWRALAVTSARDNPIQAASAAALLVYPAWRLARALPTPMVVAGLGVFLATKARSDSAKRIVARVADSGAQVRDAATDRLKKIGDQGADAIHAANEAIQDVSHSVAAAAGSQLAQAADNASAALSNALDAVRPSDDTLHTIKESTQAAASSAANMGRRAASSGLAYSRGAATTVAENPILVAGLGLAVGSLLAALLPAINAEPDARTSAPAPRNAAAKMHARKHTRTGQGGQL